MSESFLERLSRFTPDAGRVDRDALLFATGRASARPNRGWISLAAVLASTQLLSLVFLWPHATPPGVGTSTQVANAPAPSMLPGPPAFETSANPGLWSVRPSLLKSDPEGRPDTGTFVDSGPPLRAFNSPSSFKAEPSL